MAEEIVEAVVVEEVEEERDIEDDEDCGGCGECDYCCPDEDEDEDEDENETYCGEDVREKYASFVDHLRSVGFKDIDSGCFRTVMGRKHIVIKIPHNTDGIVDNRVEATAWRKYKNRKTDNGYFLAPCRLLANGCLLMMMVDTEWEPTKEDNWIYSIDGAQAGRYHGRTVAYDYALNVSERVVWEEEWELYGNCFRNNWL